MTELDEDPRITAVRQLRDELREAPDSEWTGADLAGYLDAVLEEDGSDEDPLLDGAARVLWLYVADEDGFDQERVNTIAARLLGYARPRVAIAVVDEIADAVAGTPMRCPVHDAVDCNVNTNGCGLVTEIPRTVADFIRTAKSVIAEDMDDSPVLAPTPIETDDVSEETR